MRERKRVYTPWGYSAKRCFFEESNPSSKIIELWITGVLRGYKEK